MSEYYKEQHPLLCEDISEEEHYSPRYPRRLRSSTYRGRTRNNLKGAASIITRWPDHWSSFVAYWWIGLGMISLMTFVVYNSLFAFSMLPTANLKPASLIIANKNARILPKTSCPDVFMHIFAKPTEEVDFGQYMPYIEALSDKYPNVKYHLMVVVNDTTNLGWLSAEENNEIALNSLWNKNPKKEPIYSNIAIEYITLSAYMENSPLRKYWRSLPHQLIEFLSRAISIWDKGGIAFDPIILTPKSQHTIYTEKIQKLLDKYAEVDKTVSDFKLMNKPSRPSKKGRKLNNIRDIINALENEDDSMNAFSQETLTEAENIKAPIVTKSDRHLFTATENKVNNVSDKNTEPFNKIQIHPQINAYSSDSDTRMSSHRMVNNSTETAVTLDVSQNTTKLSLLPLFLEFLFHNKLNVKTSPTEATTTNRTRKSVIQVPKSEEVETSLSTSSLERIDKRITDTYQPVIISAAGIYNKSENPKLAIDPPNQESDAVIEKNRLTIDLKGNIIATDTACHAFLGTIFSNAIHHSQEESVTDFIIAELTIFCKGLLSSCMGIDLILL
ncbi:uncharacterized protein LOC124633518 isoform X1 [Helicoverpa zea]|uniref:uncharacterized protein LOC124633518 isoform X1 n=1 Tax=Helicoverpa zea TaxID=7113 RepID=UPI001F5AD6A0|nr:uncharacterized protein LOC124633518 isoform X1 [Helicoverpa zea]